MASLYKRNGVYYVAIDLEGKRVYQSTRTTRKSEALQYLSRLKMNPPRRIVARLAAFLEDFWKFSERTHARHSFITNKWTTGKWTDGAQVTTE